MRARALDARGEGLVRALFSTRLNDDGPARGGAFRDQEIDVGLALEWRPKAGAKLRLDAGLAVWRELEFFDTGGDKLSETEVDPAPYAALSLELGF